MKLTYFPVRGRVEPSRLMLALARVHYDFEGIPMEEWIGQDAKERTLQRTPFGQLPVLEDGSLVLCQSRAIHRYLARKLDLYGNTIEENARVDEVFETADELQLDISMFHWNPQFHDKRAEHRESTRKKLTLLQTYFKRTRADAERWALPGRYTLADAAMSFYLESVLPLHPGLLQEFPELHHAMTRFFAADGVREYVRSDQRPRTWTVSKASFAGRPEETHHWTD